MILKMKKTICASSGKGKMWEWKQCGMRGLHIGAIGQADEDAIQCGNFIGAGSIGAEGMDCATGFSDGSGLGGGNYIIKSKIVNNNFLIIFSYLC